MFRRVHRSACATSVVSSSLAWCGALASRSCVRGCSTTPSTPQSKPSADKSTEASAEGAASPSPSDISVHQETGIQKKTGGFLEPSDDVVLEYARHALKREGRDEIPESIIWKWETTHPPILAQGKQNYFDYTDDIPAHVKPFWHHEYYQQREYFKQQREKKPLMQRILGWSWLLAGVGVIGVALACFRIWVDQPKQIRQLREEMLQQTYGRVLELAAGHGQNIGAYPYAVHEIVMCDSSPQQLQSLRYRIPKTAYPKYDIRRMRSEKLDGFQDGEFDCVVDMFGLCHLQDPVMALRQMQRVLKPTGMIVLLEHGQSPYPWVNWFLDYFEKRHNVNTHGCKWNMPVREYLREARLEVRELRNLHYGTTYYVVAYPEQVDAYKERVARSTGSVAVA
ncbi:methyltransferase family 23, putative [Bodo saltans]|uniref:Methyltransferase family 23, putative n=1 Tax=Bodo saltans TaxID=75058 RepID=A0A0S4J626_BODSA|nr:methyltransferase family 23, putative [Bodo saltans]|eukprot:CUG84152.1 methyltransferase family 23, putative [Bodo saltans]